MNWEEAQSRGFLCDCEIFARLRLNLRESSFEALQARLHRSVCEGAAAVGTLTPGRGQTSAGVSSAKASDDLLIE